MNNTASSGYAICSDTNMERIVILTAFTIVAK